jgi:hypothetical protein
MKQISTLTRRKLVSATTIAGITAVTGCSGILEPSQPVGRDRELDQFGIYKEQFDPGSEKTYSMNSSFYSEVVHEIERESDNEGYAKLGAISMEVGKVISDPQRRVESGIGRPYKKGNVIELFSQIDLETKSIFTHKMSPGIYYVEFDGRNLGKSIEINWNATVYRYYQDPSNLDCSDQKGQIELDYLYINEGSNLGSPSEILFDISYSGAELDTYDLDVTIQSPNRQTSFQLTQPSGDCTTAFIGRENFNFVNSVPKSPYIIIIEVKGKDGTLASKTVELTE